MLSRKHYKAIAEIIAAVFNELPDYFLDKFENCQYHVIAEIADNLADYFATDNPRFDRDKFLAACGL